MPFQPYLGDTRPLKVLQDNRVLAGRQLTGHGRGAVHRLPAIEHQLVVHVAVEGSGNPWAVPSGER
jgi:hypothetical protein